MNWKQVDKEVEAIRDGPGNDQGMKVLCMLGVFSTHEKVDKEARLALAKELARIDAALPDEPEHLVDIWINLFFGIGVIWTAIGMRGALLEGLGELNSQSAAQLGAFSILQRLVDGGILLALSTTIFGAVGGYLLRLVKSLTVGTRVKAYYNQLAEQQAASVHHVLQSIDERLGQMVTITEKPQ